MHRFVPAMAALTAALVGSPSGVVAEEKTTPRPRLPVGISPDLHVAAGAKRRHGGGGTKGRIMARRIDNPNEYHPVSAEDRRVRRNRRKAGARSGPAKPVWLFTDAGVFDQRDLSRMAKSTHGVGAVLIPATRADVKRMNRSV